MNLLTNRFNLIFPAVTLIMMMLPSIAAADFEIIDPGAGRYTSMLRDSEGDIHISYTAGNEAVRYARKSGDVWETETVEALSTEAGTSLALDSLGRPHISYYSVSISGLRHAYYDGSQWVRETVISDGTVGRYSSIAIDSSGNIHISYFADSYGTESNCLYYARKTGTGWSSPIKIDSAEFVTGKHNSLAVDSAGNVHIIYDGNGYSKLKYAEGDGVSFSTSTVYTASDKTAYDTFMVIDSSDIPHISFICQDSPAGVKYAFREGESWHIEHAAARSSADFGYGTSLALDSDGRAHISYFDPGGKNLAYAHNSAGFWTSLNMDTSTDAGRYSSIIIDGESGPAFSYYDGDSGNLKHAFNLDIAPPEGIADLEAVTGTGADEVVLEWSAPEEVGHYHVKFTTHTDFNWETGWTQAHTFDAALQPSGYSVETVTAALNGGATHYIAIRAYNAMGSFSLSNSTSAYARDDDAPPSAITQLLAGRQGCVEGEILLTWTSPGDNGMEGILGKTASTPGRFVIEHSTDSSYISWSTSTAQIGIEAAEIEPGENLSRKITGLVPGTTCYFRIWTADEVPNWSGISSGATAWAQIDVTPPGTSTIRAMQIKGSSDTVRIEWKAAGDDGYKNPLVEGSGFLVYHSTSYPDSPSHTDAQVDISTSGVSPSSNLSYTVTGLREDTPYHFILWTYDESGNVSGYSNTSSTSTADLTPPAAVTGLAADRQDCLKGEIRLIWTSPGDNEWEEDIESGLFAVQYATYSLSWSSSSANIIESFSSPALSAQFYTVTGLEYGATYYFRIWTADEVSNWSALSNGATAWAQTDNIAPGTSELNVRPLDGKVLLDWEAPGDDGDENTLDGFYEIRWSTQGTIDSGEKWDNIFISSVSFSTSSVQPGSPVSYTVAELENFREYWFSIRATDLSGNRAELSNSPRAIPSPDTDPPDIEPVFVPPGTIYMLENSIRIIFKTSDGNSGVTEAVFYHRTKGASVYSSKTLFYSTAGVSATGQLEKTIAPEEITETGIEYYFIVYDRAGNWRLSGGAGGTQPQSPEPQPLSINYEELYSVKILEEGGKAELPSGNPGDGTVSVTIPRKALKKPEVIGIKQENVNNIPLMDGQRAAAAWSFFTEGQLFSRPVTIELLYIDLDNDGIVDETSIRAADLKAFHWDGQDWRLAGGEPVTGRNTVSLNTRHFSTYALFEYTGTLSAEESAPRRRIITPNDDGINDYAEFSGLQEPYTLKIFNINGSLVKEISDGSNPVWDGANDGGGAVESGPYIYELRAGGETVYGVIVVAK